MNAGTRDNTAALAAEPLVDTIRGRARLVLPDGRGSLRAAAVVVVMVCGSPVLGYQPTATTRYCGLVTEMSED